MSTPLKLAAFAATLATLVGAGALAGGSIGPDRDKSRVTHSVTTTDNDGVHAVSEEDETVSVSHSNIEAGVHGGGEAAAHPVRGLAVAENDLRVVVENPELRRGRTEQLRFRVVDAGDETVRDFDLQHEKRMHLIVVRRDLATFQHLHPEQRPDGSWRSEIKLDEAGSYRLFADFSSDGAAHTLASDLRVDGDADLRPLPPPSPTSASDGGYDVRLSAGRTRPDAEANLRFAISRGGEQVHPEPYLGAGGHLVALREGDLAFLHVHPTESAHGARATGDEHDDSVGFAATFPTAGRYRLFLQFKHEGRVETVAFTQEVE